MKNYLVEAIFKLRPGSEFVIHENDYANVEWHVLEGKAPTQVEIDAEIENIKSQQAADEIARAVAKADLLAKLGITEDEAKLLLG